MLKQKLTQSGWVSVLCGSVCWLPKITVISTYTKAGQNCVVNGWCTLGWVGKKNGIKSSAQTGWEL